MSERIKKIIFPKICISYTISILIIALGNFISGIKRHIMYGRGVSVNVFCLFALELFVIICLITAACTVLEKQRFKNKISYFVFELIINYIFILGGAYVFRWMKFSPENVMEIAFIMIIATALYANLYFYTQKRRKKEADVINRLLKKREREQGKMKL